MAQFIEPIILNGIDKDVAPNGIDYSNRKVLNPVRDVLNARYFSSEGEEEYQVENIKGTEEVTSGQFFTKLTINDEFTGSLDGWSQVSVPSGLTWSYVSNAAQIVGAGASVSKIIIQEVEVVVGTLATFNVVANWACIGSITNEANIIGYFLNAFDVVIETFNILTLSTISLSDTVSINKVVPSGAVKIGFAVSKAGVSSYVLNLDKGSVSGFKEAVSPDGLSECIGTYENIEKNLLIYFLWNNNGYHGVFKYDSSTDSTTQILADDPNNPVLKFSNNPRYVITGIGMIGDLLSWTDNLNPQRCINITRQYSVLNDFIISLIKIGPRKRPIFSAKQQDITITTNNLESNNFQFSYQYVYLDGEVSVLSPYSALMLAETIPNLSDKTRAYTNVSHIVDAEVINAIKYVRLIFRKNNDPNWYIWKTVSVIGSTVTERFYNHEIGTLVDSVTTSKIFDSIPNKSKALAIFKGRIFLNSTEEGFEMETGVVLTAQVSAPFSALGPGFDKGPYLKKHGKVRVGYVEWDKFGRSSVIMTSKLVNGISWDYASLSLLQNQLNIDASNSTNVKLQASISKLTVFQRRKSIVTSADIVYESYFQTLAIPLFFVKNYVDGAVLVGDEVQIGDRVYLKTPPSVPTTYSKLHLLISKESPFIPDNTYLVRIVNFTATSVSSLVLNVTEVIDGDIIVTNNFNVGNWQSILAGTPMSVYLLIEVFKIKEVQEPFYYEVTEPLVSSLFFQNIGGDQYLIGPSVGNNVPSYTFRNFGFSKLFYLQNHIGSKPSSVLLEGPSPTKIEKYITGAADVNQGSSVRTYAFNHEKSAWGRGRPFVEGIQRIVNRGATIRYSDTFIEGSEINGLNSFLFENLYDKIGQDRSSIIRLVPTGNIVVCVHERQITTLYIGEGIIRTGDTGFLSKTDSVIGDDRKLIGEYGSFHPESVQEVDGKIFGFDIFSGAVWRYTVEGIFAVSDYGMKNYFRDKSRDYFDVKDTIKFVGAIDRYHKEYLLTLPHKYATLYAPDLLSFGGATGTYDIVLDPEDYILGDTYRIKISAFKQSGTDNDSINIAFLFDGVINLKSGIRYDVETSLEGSSESLYIEFVFNGEGFIRMNITGIGHPIYVRISTEYQEIKGETWAFNYEAKRWTSRYSFVPEFMGRIGDKLFSFKNGILYRHNVSDQYNNFYGVQYERQIKVSCNPQPNKVKVWSALHVAAQSVCADETSAFKVMECSNDQGQSSYTRAKEFEKKEGVYYAPILKDVNTNPDLLAAGRIALRDGKDMRSKSLEVTIHNDRTDQSLLQKLNIVGENSEFSI